MPVLIAWKYSIHHKDLMRQWTSACLHGPIWPTGQVSRKDKTKREEQDRFNCQGSRAVFTKANGSGSLRVRSTAVAGCRIDVWLNQSFLLSAKSHPYLCSIGIRVQASDGYTPIANCFIGMSIGGNYQ